MGATYPDFEISLDKVRGKKAMTIVELKYLETAQTVCGSANKQDISVHRGARTGMPGNSPWEMVFLGGTVEEPCSLPGPGGLQSQTQGQRRYR